MRLAMELIEEGGNEQRTSLIQTLLIALGTDLRGYEQHVSFGVNARVMLHTFPVSAAAIAVISVPMKAKAALIRTKEWI